MSDTPRSKQGVPTHTSIGYAGSLPGRIARHPEAGADPSLSTRQGFAPLSAEERAQPELDPAEPRRAKPAVATMPMPLLEPARADVPPRTPLERPRIQMPPLEPPRPQPPPGYPPAQPPRAAVRPRAAMPGMTGPARPHPPERSRVQVPITPEEAKTTVWKGNVADITTDELPPLRRVQRWWFLLPIAPLTFIFAYLVFGAPEPEPTTGTTNPAGSSPAVLPRDSSVVVERGSIALRAETPGLVRGRVETEVLPEVEGVVAAVHVKSGQAVKAGDPLLSFDGTSLRKQLRAANQAVTDRKAELHVQRLRRDAVRRDMNSGLLWPAEMEAAEAEMSRAEARLKAALAERRRVQERGRASSLIAPTSGVVRDLMVQVGDALEPGKRGAARPLLVIEDPGKVALFADLSPELASRVDVGVRARVKVEGMEGNSFEASISDLPKTPGKDPEGNDVFRAELLMEAGADVYNLPPGTRTVVQLPAGKKNGVLLVPAAAVKTDNAGSTVEVWSPEQKQYERRVVQTGAANETHVEVVNNLAEGDRVRLPGKS